MKKLAILLVVLALCTPTYGYILVYKLSMSGTEAYPEDDPHGWVLRHVSGRAYLVLDVGDDPSELNGVQFITYYTEDGTKLYDTWTAGENFTQTVMPGRPPKGRDIIRVEVDLMSGTGTTLAGRVFGTVKSMDIGTLDGFGNKEKVDVATSLKGGCAFENSQDHSAGTGTLSVTLDSKWTKTANNPDKTKGFGGDIGSFLDPESGPPDMPRGLLNWLESKGYNPADEEEP